MKFDFSNKYISLAFRSKNYFEEIFSFYVFRILYLRKDEALFYPLDSNIGNLCLPEEEDGKYYCNLIIENKYNEFSSHFAVIPSNQIEYLIVNYAPYFKNGTLGDYKYKDFNFLFNTTTDTNENITKFFFKIEFKRNGIKNILSAFNHRTEEDHLQIYSPRLFHLFRQTLFLNFSLTHNYTLTLKHFSGWAGGISLNYVGLENIFTSRNYRGKPIAIELTSEKRMEFWCFVYEFVFFLQLSYNSKNKEIEEINEKETKSVIMENGYFPLYYYLNITEKNNVNIDISVRLNSYDLNMMQNNYDIKGYLVDEDSIKRKIRGEHITLRDDDAILGTYSECYNFGYIQITQDHINDDDYLLISIANKDQTKIETYFLVEIVCDEHLFRYFMPINQYIIETTHKDTNQYYLNINDIYHYARQENSSILVEFSPNYEDLQLNFEQDHLIVRDFYTTGFHKYRIITSNEWVVYFNISNPKQRKDGNYILRYYYSTESGEYNYVLDKNYKYNQNKSDSESVSITLTFNNIDILENGTQVTKEGSNIAFNIFAYLYPKNASNDELVNVSTLIHRKYLYQTKAKSNYKDNSFQIYFDKISRKDNFMYDLQFKINALLSSKIFNEEILTFTIDLDLKDIANKEEDSSNMLTIILIVVIIAIFIGLIILFFVYRQVRRANSQLKEKVLDISYATGIEKNVLKEEHKKQGDEDYESTFI